MEVKRYATILDVRTPEEYASEHYPGAINIPCDQVAKRIDEFAIMPKPIIAYCKTGNRSGLAVSILKQAGITEAFNVGGLDDFRQRMK